MAPRTRKAAPALAGVEDGCPSLKLIMEKGPLSGQTSEFRLEAQIQIGRVVRGNTLCIKDAGISTKHLLIQVNPDAAGRRLWTATDLGSSNGTILNDALLDPSEPVALSDGDVIKIGEKTSIKVAFGVTSGGEVEVNASNVRRNARRGVRKQVELVVIDEDSELGLGNTNMGPVGINEKNVELGNEGGELGATGEIKAPGRRTRGSKARGVENGSTEEIESTGKVSLRRTRCAKNNDNLSKDLNLDGDKDYEPSGMKGNRRVSVRRTRSLRKEENTVEPLIDLSVIECKWTRKGTQRNKKVDVETPLGEKKEESELEELKMCEEEKQISEVGDHERETLERETATEFASTSGVKEVGVEAGKEMDLEKMTLGEWFDNLEVYLPEQIIESTEDMISEMRRKAERLHESMLQQKDSEGKGNVAME